MKINIICVGKNHDVFIKSAIEDYQKRISHFVQLEWKIIPASNIDSESVAIAKKIDGGFSILLDETGTILTTPKFADKIENLQNASCKNINFIIGGAFGVTETLKNSVDFVWSLSPLVFPHQLVRLILVEQIYRAYDILAGGKYHHQ